MRNDILADRLTNYADGLVAAAFIFTSGIGATIADADSVCTLVGSASMLMVAVTVIGAAFLFALRWLRRWEQRLRTPDEDRPTRQVSTRLHWIRVSLVGGSLALCFYFLSSLGDEEASVCAQSSASLPAPEVPAIAGLSPSAILPDQPVFCGGPA